MTTLTADDAVIRTPLAVSRRISFLAAAGGCGTTSIATSVAGLVASRRSLPSGSGTVLAVDAAGGWTGLVRQASYPDRRSAGSSTATAQDAGREGRAADRDRRRAARTAADARAGLATTPAGLHLLDLTDDSADSADSARHPTSVTGWTEAVSPVARFFDLVLTDWGVRPADVDAAEAAATGHAVVVVGRADRAGALAAAGLTEALRAATTARPLLVLVDVGRTADRMLAGIEKALAVPVLLVGHEHRRGRTSNPTSRGFTAAARDAHRRVAVAVLQQVTRPVRVPVTSGHPTPEHPTPEHSTSPRWVPAGGGSA